MTLLHIPTQDCSHKTLDALSMIQSLVQTEVKTLIHFQANNGREGFEQQTIKQVQNKKIK